MPRVKINDLPVLQPLNAAQAKGIYGGRQTRGSISQIMGQLGKLPSLTSLLGMQRRPWTTLPIKRR